MPTFEALISANRQLNKKESYDNEEIDRIRESLIERLEGWMLIPHADDGFATKEYDVKVDNLTFVTPLRPLSDISVSLAALRAAIVETMQMGVSEMPVDTLLHLIRGVYETQKD
jgi:chromatin segregation and condensation protein Rec8/ScpA/Scc1 (kleisin family)